MKKLILTLLCSIPLWSATVYKIPPVVVENTPLFCSDYYGEKITIRQVGDIMDGQIVIDRCGYTQEIAMQKQNNMKAIHNKDKDEINNYVLYTIIGIMGCALLLLTGMFCSAMNDKDDKDKDDEK